MNVIYHTYHFIIVFFVSCACVVYYILMLQKSIHFNVMSSKQRTKSAEHSSITYYNIQTAK